MRRRTVHIVHPAIHRIVKFLPTIPPSRGDVVLVDGERRRVVRAKVDWDDSTWTIREIRVVPA